MGKRIVNAIVFVFIAAVVLLAAAFAFAKMQGGGVYSVLSGSMQPAYKTGSLIFVKPVNLKDLKEGDVITFAQAEGVTVTHRIVSITKDGDSPDAYWFTTKGDANDVKDMAPVNGRNVIGSPVFRIPYAGYVINYIKTPPGLFIAIGVVLLFVVLALMPVLRKRKN